MSMRSDVQVHGGQTATCQCVNVIWGFSEQTLPCCSPGRGVYLQLTRVTVSRSKSGGIAWPRRPGWVWPRGRERVMGSRSATVDRCVSHLSRLPFLRARRRRRRWCWCCRRRCAPCATGTVAGGRALAPLLLLFLLLLLFPDGRGIPGCRCCCDQSSTGTGESKATGRGWSHTCRWRRQRPAMITEGNIAIAATEAGTGECCLGWPCVCGGGGS